MKKIALYILILLEIGLIISIKAIERAYRGSGSTEWTDAGYIIMRYLWAPMLFFVLCLIVATFIRKRIALRIFIGILAIAGLIIFNKIYLYPF
jgi:hypothetical protein